MVMSRRRFYLMELLFNIGDAMTSQLYIHKVGSKAVHISVLKRKIIYGHCGPEDFSVPLGCHEMSARNFF